MAEHSDATIFGRDRELAEIEAVLRGTAFAGVVIEGERGMGKSRLAAHVHAARGGDELWIRGDRVLADIPFGAFGLFVDLDDDPATHLGKVVAALTEGSGVPVVFADDAHYLDDSSLGALWQLAGDGEIRLVAMVRPTLDGRVGPFGELIADGLLRHVLLDPLRLDDVAAMLEHHLGGVVSRGALDAAAFQSSGVPGRVIELLRSSRRSSSLLFRRGVWLLDGLDTDYDDRARDVVSDHLSRYTDEQREALEFVVLAGEVEVELMLATGLGEAADSLVAAGVLALESRSAPVYVSLESHSTETVRRMVPVGRSRRMLALLETDPGTPSQRARMLRADWALSNGTRVSVDDSIDAARIAARLGEWQRALRILTEVPTEAMDAPALFDLARLHCDVNLIPVGCDILAQAVRRAECPFLVVEAFVVWVLRDVERISPPLSMEDFHAALERIAAAGDAEVAEKAELARSLLDRISESSWAGLPGDDGSVMRWLGAEDLAETLRTSIAIVCAAKELERGRPSLVLGLLDRIEEVSATIGTTTIMIDLARGWTLMQLGRTDEVAQLLTAVKSSDPAFQAARSGSRDLLVTRILAEEGRWREAFRAACAAAEAIDHRHQHEFAALAFAQAEYTAMMSGNGDAADDFADRYRRLPAVGVYVEARRSQILHLVSRAKLTGQARYRSALDEALREAEAEGVPAAAAAVRLEVFRHFGDFDAEAMTRLGEAFDADARDGRLLRGLGPALQEQDADALIAVAEDRASHLPDLVERCRALAAQWRGATVREPVRSTGSSVFDVQLTSRERQISRLIMAGLTNAEIGAELGVAVRTVEGHTYRMFRKLGISSRAEVAEALDRLEVDASA